jgi:hypothetical protein
LSSIAPRNWPASILTSKLLPAARAVQVIAMAIAVAASRTWLLDLMPVTLWFKTRYLPT